MSNENTPVRFEVIDPFGLGFEGLTELEGDDLLQAAQKAMPDFRIEVTPFDGSSRVWNVLGFKTPTEVRTFPSCHECGVGKCTGHAPDREECQVSVLAIKI